MQFLVLCLMLLAIAVCGHPASYIRNGECKKWGLLLQTTNFPFLYSFHTSQGIDLHISSWVQHRHHLSVPEFFPQAQSLAEEEEDDSPRSSRHSEDGADTTPQSRLRTAQYHKPTFPRPTSSEMNGTAPVLGTTAPRPGARLTALKAKLEADRAKKAQR